MKWMRSCFCVLAFLTACGAPLVKPSDTVLSPQPILSASPDSNPSRSSPVPSASPFDSTWLDELVEESYLQAWESVGRSLTAAIRQHEIFDPDKHAVGAVSENAVLYYRLPKVSGLQALIVKTGENGAWVAVYENRKYEKEDIPRSIIGGKGYFLLRTDLYDTYIEIKSYYPDRSFNMKLVQWDVKTDLEKLRRPAGGFECTSRAGTVYDEAGEPVAGVTIRAAGVYSFMPFYSETTTDEQGNYHFDILPYGIPLVFEAQKKGYGKQSRQEPIRMTDSDAINFGVPQKWLDQDWYDERTALSAKPEIAEATPVFDWNKGDFLPGKLVSRTPEFKVRFSKPVQPHTFTDDFQILAYTPAQRMEILPERGNLSSMRWDLVQDYRGLPVADQHNFIFKWNQDFTAVTIRFKPGHQLPLPESPELEPHFEINFEQGDSTLIAKDGTKREGAYFKSGFSYFETGYPMSLARQ